MFESPESHGRMTMRVSEGQARLAAPRVFWVKRREAESCL